MKVFNFQFTTKLTSVVDRFFRLVPFQGQGFYVSPVFLKYRVLKTLAGEVKC